jgi:hypothetical protein
MKTMLAALLVVGIILVSGIGLVATSFRVAMISHPTERAWAMGAELVAGVVWLLGTTYVATRLTVQVFAEKPRPQS